MHLMKGVESEYKTDYHSFFVAGESKPLDSGRPYLIRGRTRDIGILVIHGYMASPLEVKALAEYLGRQGFWVFAPRHRRFCYEPEIILEPTAAGDLTLTKDFPLIVKTKQSIQNPNSNFKRQPLFRRCPSKSRPRQDSCSARKETAGKPGSQRPATTPVW